MIETQAASQGGAMFAALPVAYKPPKQSAS